MEWIDLSAPIDRDARQLPRTLGEASVFQRSGWLLVVYTHVLFAWRKLRAKAPEYAPALALMLACYACGLASMGLLEAWLEAGR